MKILVVNDCAVHNALIKNELKQHKVKIVSMQEAPDVIIKSKFRCILINCDYADTKTAWFISWFCHHVPMNLRCIYVFTVQQSLTTQAKELLLNMPRRTRLLPQILPNSGISNIIEMQYSNYKVVNYYTIMRDRIGSITIAHEYNPQSKKLRVGFAFCSPADMYSKHLGRTIAKNRFTDFSIEIEDIKYNNYGKIDCFKTIIDYLRTSLDANKDLKTAFGVRMYNNCNEPQEREFFRWWLNKFLTIIEAEKNKTEKPDLKVVEE